VFFFFSIMTIYFGEEITNSLKEKVPLSIHLVKHEKRNK